MSSGCGWRTTGLRVAGSGLHPRLNVLIGPNGAGKSSVLRALGMMLAHLQGGFVLSTIG
ncbi:MAG: AAA family ATPase [bacterium]